MADGLCSTAPGALTFPIAQRLVQEIVTVTEDEIRIALRFLFERLKLVVEPSGAVGLAALLAGKVRSARPAVVLTGGNVGIEQLGALTRQLEVDAEQPHDAVSWRYGKVTAP
jgi:threonine dehydratase